MNPFRERDKVIVRNGWSGEFFVADVVRVTPKLIHVNSYSGTLQIKLSDVALYDAEQWTKLSAKVAEYKELNGKAFEAKREMRKLFEEAQSEGRKGENEPTS